jgi:hypothetical protein
MTIDRHAPLPRWGGISEPMTVLTNLILAVVSFVLGARLAYVAAAEGLAAGGFLALALLSTAVAAVFGAAAHGTDPRVDPVQRDRCWRGALYLTGIVAAATIASVAYFAASGHVRTTLLVLSGIKLVAYFIRVSRRAEFRVAAEDYGASLAVLLVGAVYVAARWSSPAAPWLIGGVAVSLVAALVQQRQLSMHRHFNHNDLYHVIQIVALYLFYFGGRLLVDR